MKGLSILLTSTLLVLAHQLARHMEKTGNLPVETAPSAGMAFAPASEDPHPLTLPGKPINL